MTAEAIGAILSEIQGLLHEARSNVEIDLGKGQKLIDRLAAAKDAHHSGRLSPGELADVAREIGDGIKPSIEKELSIDNPEAAVIQIRSLLDQLERIA